MVHSNQQTLWEWLFVHSDWCNGRGKNKCQQNHAINQGQIYTCVWILHICISYTCVFHTLVSSCNVNFVSHSRLFQEAQMVVMCRGTWLQHVFQPFFLKRQFVYPELASVSALLAAEWCRGFITEVCSRYFGQSEDCSLSSVPAGGRLCSRDEDDGSVRIDFALRLAFMHLTPCHM